MEFIPDYGVNMMNEASRLGGMQSTTGMTQQPIMGSQINQPIIQKGTTLTEPTLIQQLPTTQTLPTETYVQ
jgi:hypothetical protein